jgi:hypothetical protein
MMELVLAAAAQSAAASCSLSPADQAWLDRSVGAWNYTSAEITGLGRSQSIEAIFFDKDCVVTSATAMNGGPQRWSGRMHKGEIAIPNGPTIPAGVTSFAMGGDGKNYFVMSTPSIWRAAVKSDNGLGSLETLMTAVVLHEATHVAQVPTYGKRMERLAARHGLPEEFNDDSIQERFQGNAAFAASVKRESDLFLAAASAARPEQARRLARQARRLMKARQQRWYRGKDAFLAEAEDIWLSMEGSAQWAAFQWVRDGKGGGVAPATALASFSTGKWWSQVEGFALFMALDRLTGGSWKRHAFGDGAKTAVQMIDEAIAADRRAGAR